MKRQLFGFIVASFAWCGGSAFLASGQTTSFSDGFEGAALNPFWTASTVNGATMTAPATGQAHSGGQSVQFDAPPGGYAWLSHTFATPVYGQMSVWVYEPMLSEMDVLLGIGIPGVSEADVYSANGGNYAGLYAYDLTAIHFTGAVIERTGGWQQLSISALDTGLTLSANGNVLYSGPALPLTTLLFQTSHEDGTGSLASPIYWDDFSGSFTPVPEPSAWVLLLLAGTTISSLKLKRKRG